MSKHHNAPAGQKPPGTQLSFIEDAPLPATINDEFGSMATGLENVKSKDLIIPRLTILQALSPQLQKNKPEFIRGAEAGDFCDTATGDVFKAPLKIVPVYFATVYLEWAPRNTGKGLVANHGMDASILAHCKPDEKRRMVLPSGNYVAETATYFVLNLTAGGRRSFIPLNATQLKASRKWMTLIMNQRLKRGDGSEFTPPLFYRSWNASVVEQSNNDGSWFGWKFEPGDPIMTIDPQRNLLTEAKEFCEQAKNGLFQGDVGAGDEEPASGSDAPM